MLTTSLSEIKEVLKTSGLGHRVRIHPLKRDFLNMEGAETRLRRRGKSVAWFIPGGTVGNIDEERLFNAIKSKAEANDLLILGAETYGSKLTGAIRNELKRKYRAPEFRNFLRPSLQSIWHELDIKDTLDNRLKKIEVKIVDGPLNMYSSVPDAATVEMSLIVNGRKIVLLTSTRYSETQLKAFANQQHFICETTVSTTANPQYKLFVFRYVPE